MIYLKQNKTQILTEKCRATWKNVMLRCDGEKRVILQTTATHF